MTLEETKCAFGVGIGTGGDRPQKWKTLGNNSRESKSGKCRGGDLGLPRRVWRGEGGGGSCVA